MKYFTVLVIFISLTDVTISIQFDTSVDRKFGDDGVWASDLSLRRDRLLKLITNSLKHDTDLTREEKSIMKNAMETFYSINLADLEKKALLAADNIRSIVPGLIISRCEYLSSEFDCLHADPDDGETIFLEDYEDWMTDMILRYESFESKLKGFLDLPESKLILDTFNPILLLKKVEDVTIEAAKKLPGHLLNNEAFSTVIGHCSTEEFPSIFLKKVSFDCLWIKKLD